MKKLLSMWIIGCLIVTMLPCVTTKAMTVQSPNRAPLGAFRMKYAKKNTNLIFEKSDPFALTVYDTNGNVIPRVEYGKYDDNGVWHKVDNVDKKDMSDYISKVYYTYVIKKKKGKKGYGTYQITVKGCEEYRGVTLKKTVRLVPNADDIHMSFFYYRDKAYRIKGIRDKAYYVEANYSKQVSQYLDGVQYVYAKDKKFKKIYKKGKMKLTKPKKIKTAKNDRGSKGKIGSVIPKIKYGKCYVKWRVYKKVKGKKIYSKWKKQRMWMNGYVIREIK